MSWLTQVRTELGYLFKDRPIVLVDVGASGNPPRAWRDLAPLSTYVGFDPDSRGFHESNEYGFDRFLMVNKAVSDTDERELEFFLTASPFCSSALEPNFDTLSEYGFTDLFRVERTTRVPATTLQTALRENGLDHIDWMKLDTQGKDLDVLRSLGDATADRLLALDVEPGVVDFYRGENTFTQAHSYLVENGYWLAGAAFQEYPKIAESTRERLTADGVDFALLPGNPTAVEARYYRTREHLRSAGADVRDRVCAWIVAMVHSDYGFALDIAADLREVEAGRDVGGLLVKLTSREMGRTAHARAVRFRRAVRAVTPNSLRPLLRRIHAALTGQ